MLRHYLVSSIRNFWRHKFHTLINMLGLAIGLACCIFILLYIRDELGYDRFHENVNELYRIYVKGKIGEMDLLISETAPPTGPVFRDEFPEVVNFTRLNEWNDVQFLKDDISFIENDVYLVDSTFLSMFTFPLLDGDPETALTEPYTVVLTESVAEKYFGEEDPMNRTLRMGEGGDLYRITGIMPDITHQTHFDFSMLVSVYSWDRIKQEIWLSHFLNTYLLVEKGTDKEKLEEKFIDIVMNYIGPEFEEYMGVPMDRFAEQGNSYGIYLEPVADIHFNTRFDRPLKPAHNKNYIYIFSLIALFILIIAVINFMNLATARAQSRTKEVGIRKVVGAGRKLLIRQFLYESVLLTLISLFIAILLVEVLMQPFNNLIRLQLDMKLFENWYNIPVILAFTLFTGFLAGSYPSLYLSSFNPVTIINKSFQLRAGKINFRNILVFIQFLISIFIITGTVFIYMQIRYVQNKELGFNREHLLILPNGYNLGKDYFSFRDQVRQLPGVVSMTRHTSMPGQTSNTTGYKLAGDPEGRTFLLETNYADYYFLETYGIELAEGRYFNEAFGRDSASMLINETTIKTFNLVDPLSCRFTSPEIPNIKPREDFDVIGVVKDFHFESMHNDIRSYTLLLWPESFDMGGIVSIRVGPENISNTVKQIEKAWDQFNPGSMTWFFLDDWFNDMYQDEERTGRMFLLFSILAIFIASLGLFGLSAFVAEQRTREIGVRKVLGSSGFGLIGLMSRQILILVTVSAAVAVPAAWFFMNDWLQDFAYKISLRWYIFLAAYLAALAIALVTTMYHSAYAISRNPAESLRYE